jgi:hypothetical protein
VGSGAGQMMIEGDGVALEAHSDLILNEEACDRGKEDLRR